MAAVLEILAGAINRYGHAAEILKASNVDGGGRIRGVLAGGYAGHGRQNLLDRPLLYRMVDSLSLAPVGGSDNHGWGRTAAAWTLVHIPAWRGMRPDSLARRIEIVLRPRRRWAARTIERRTPQVGPRLSELLLVVPAMLYELKRMATETVR